MSEADTKIPRDESRCSFCGRLESETERLFSGQPLAKKGGVPTPFTCAVCVRQAQEKTLEVRELESDDRPWAEKMVREYFVTSQIVTGKSLVDTRELPGLVAIQNGSPVGLLHFQTKGSECEVVVLISDQPRRGIGKFLLRSLEDLAHKKNWERLWLFTSNDNLSAAALFESLGWEKVPVHKGAAREARSLKPEIPEREKDGTAVEDAVEFEKRVAGESHQSTQ